MLQIDPVNPRYTWCSKAYIQRTVYVGGTKNQVLVNVEIVHRWKDSGTGKVCLEYPANIHGKVA
jgi:hypothetical protein